MRKQLPSSLGADPASQGDTNEPNLQPGPSSAHGSKPRTILRYPDLEARDGKSRVQRWRDIRAGKHPAPVQLGPNSVGFFEDEYEAYLANLPRVNYAPRSKSAAA